MIKSIFEYLRSKMASQNRKSATFFKGPVRLDSGLLIVERALAIMLALALILPSTPVMALELSTQDVIADYIDVKFELIDENPVSVTFEVIVTSTYDKDLKLPIEILVSGVTTQTITLNEVKRYAFKIKEPVYEQVIVEYKVKGKAEVSRESELTELSENYFIDRDKDGSVLKEGYYETYDERAQTFYWTETVQTGEKKVDKVEEYIVETKVKEKEKDKAKPVYVDIPAHDKDKDTKLSYTVTIETGLLQNVNGWGSAGIMTWRIAGYDYKDLKNSSWWATNWEYKRRITYDSTSIAENLEGFPVVVFLDDTFNYDNCQPDGDDFRFVDSEGNNLAYEIDLSSDFTDSAIFYVNVTEIEAGIADGWFDMYYGNPSAIAGENKHAVWDDNFVAVYHMNDNPAGDGILDSTSNENHGTKGAGAAAPTEVDGLVGKAQSFVRADNQYIQLSETILYGDDATVLFVVKPTSEIQDYHMLIAEANTSFGSIYWYGDRWRSRDSDGALVTIGDIDAINEWSALSFRQDATNHYLRVIRDGVDLSASEEREPLNAGNYIGSTTTRWGFNGPISETRISDTARGEGWISYTNSTLRNEVLTVGEETWADIPQGPTDLTYTTDGNNVLLDWIKGLIADTTVIVRGENGYPTSPTDGVVVYDGSGITAIDYGVNSEFRELYYRAWSYNDWGYSIEYAQARKGVLMTELFMVLGLTTFALWRKEIWVYLPAIIALLFFGMRWAESDLLFGLPFFALALFMIIKLGWVTFQRARP